MDAGRLFAGAGGESRRNLPPETFPRLGNQPQNLAGRVGTQKGNRTGRQPALPFVSLPVCCGSFCLIVVVATQVVGVIDFLTIREPGVATHRLRRLEPFNMGVSEDVNFPTQMPLSVFPPPPIAPSSRIWTGNTRFANHNEIRRTLYRRQSSRFPTKC